MNSTSVNRLAYGIQCAIYEHSVMLSKKKKKKGGRRKKLKNITKGMFNKCSIHSYSVQRTTYICSTCIQFSKVYLLLLLLFHTVMHKMLNFTRKPGKRNEFIRACTWRKISIYRDLKSLNLNLDFVEVEQ